MQRRRLIQALGAAMLALAVAPGSKALAQDYPARPIRLIVPFSEAFASEIQNDLKKYSEIVKTAKIRVQ